MTAWEQENRGQVRGFARTGLGARKASAKSGAPSQRRLDREDALVNRPPECNVAIVVGGDRGIGAVQV